MSDIFISYRRGDTAGHAGRLFDCVRERFGDEAVFMDVTDIHPGDDFVTSLDSALSSSRIVLAVIGPDWLTCTGADGRRRLDDPGDHLRLEISHALRANARVIPVLVRGARMPDEHELPDDLKPLARRQAQEVSDSRWPYDSDQLLRIIEEALGRHAAKAVPYRTDGRADPSVGVQAIPLAARLGPLRIVATAAVFVVLLALAAYSKWFGSAAPSGTATNDGSGASSGASTADPGSAGTPSNRRQSSTPPARLPSAGEARAGPAVYRVLGGLLSGDDGGRRTLQLYVRTINVGARYGLVISADSFRLLVDGDAIAPEEAPTEATPIQSTTDGWVTFRVPADAAAAHLQVGEVRKETAKIPIDLRAAGTGAGDTPAQTWRYPVDIAAAIEQRVGALRFNVDGVRLEHFGDANPPQPEKLQLTFKVRVKNIGSQYGYAVTSDEFRLLADDVPLAPTKFPIEALADQADLTSDVVFVIPGTAKKIVLQLGNIDHDTVRVPLDLSSAVKSSS